MKYDITLPVSEAFQTSDGLLFVSPTSPSELKEALENMAQYFKREFKYDYLQYTTDETDVDCVGFLFIERAMDKVEDIDHHPHRVIGGGCFRTINGNKKLDWVWLHPFARNRKLLKTQWPKFKQMFGDFALSTPISAQMAKFCEKHA